MSVHYIYYKDGAKMMRPVQSRKEYMALRGTEHQQRLVRAVRAGNSEAKQHLLQMNYSCLPNGDGSLRGSKAMSTTIGMDIDHIEAGEMEAVKERILQKKEELGLLMLEESARGQGYHLVFRRKTGLSQEENLQWASQLLGVEFDKGAKDITRVFFTTSAAELIYLDDEIFSLTPSPSPQGRGENVNDDVITESRNNIITENRDNELEAEAEASPRTLFIFDACMKEAELTPDVLVVEGHRHEALKSILSVGATQLLTKPELLGVLKVRMAQNWQDRNIQQLVDDFYSKYHDANQKMTQFQRKVLARSLKMVKGEGVKVQGCLADENNREPLTANQEPSLPPEMPKKLPKVVQLLVSKTPEAYRPAVAHAIFPPLGAHLWKVRFPYIDNVMHEATFMNVLMAETGAGKDCISQPINHIMADIRQRDAENLKREADWKKEVNSKGSNKDKRQRPEGLVIQEVDPDMTNPAFVMRMAEADEHFLYTKMNELDQFDALKGNGRGSQQFQIMCLAFDPDNRYGQTRVGIQSVTEKVCIRFNWNAATTVQKGLRYFRNVLTDGPISRINFCTIPEREIGADMPIYGTYDAEFDEELRPFIDRLCRAAGVVICPQAFRLAKRLKDECAEFARLSQSRVYENLSFRANVIAYLKACVLYICNDYKWSKEIEEFVRWSLKYDMYCKMLFFGEAIENANRGAEEKGRRGPRNLLEQLPDKFTVHDASLIRQANGMDTRGTRNMLAQWVHRGYLLQMTDDSFVKNQTKSK